MDAIGQFIMYSHSMLGHDKTAALIGQPPGGKSECVACRYERDPADANKQAVYEALAGPGNEVST